MELFELDAPLPKHRFNYGQHLIIIGSATDRNTIQKVQYWQSKGMLINILLYRIFRIGESHYFEFIGYPNDYYEIPLSDQWAAIVNTCRTYLPEAARDMLANNKSAAYGEITYLIDGLKKDVRVFLYHNGVGMIASGKVKGKPVSGAPPFDPTEKEKYVLLEIDCKLDPLKDIDSQRSRALSASEIKEAIGRNLFWAQTLIWVTKDEADKIAYAFKQKQGL